MSEQTETIFEIDVESKEVKTLGIPIECNLDDVKILVNDIDINKMMKIKSFKIIKVLK